MIASAFLHLRCGQLGATFIEAGPFLRDVKLPKAAGLVAQTILRSTEVKETAKGIRFLGDFKDYDLERNSKSRRNGETFPHSYLDFSAAKRRTIQPPQSPNTDNTVVDHESSNCQQKKTRSPPLIVRQARLGDERICGFQFTR